MNRGVLMTPFHNMALMSPATTAADVDRHTEVFGEAVDALFGRVMAHDRGRPGRLRPAVLLAIILDVVVIVLAIVALANGSRRSSSRWR